MFTDQSKRKIAAARYSQGSDSPKTPLIRLPPALKAPALASPGQRPGFPIRSIVVRPERAQVSPPPFQGGREHVARYPGRCPGLATFAPMARRTGCVLRGAYGRQTFYEPTSAIQCRQSKEFTHQENYSRRQAHAPSVPRRESRQESAPHPPARALPAVRAP